MGFLPWLWAWRKPNCSVIQVTGSYTGVFTFHPGRSLLPEHRCTKKSSKNHKSPTVGARPLANKAICEDTGRCTAFKAREGLESLEDPHLRGTFRPILRRTKLQRPLFSKRPQETNLNQPSPRSRQRPRVHTQASDASSLPGHVQQDALPGLLQGAGPNAEGCMETCRAGCIQHFE